MEGIEVVVLLDVGGLEDKEKFEKHVKKEGFKAIEGEDFVYTAHSTTTTFSTKAYSIRVVISPADIQKIIGTDDNIPGAVQAIQFLLRTEPDTPFVILQQAVDGIGNQIVIYGIGMRLFPIRPNTYKAFPVCGQPGIAG